jgi:hypothetical protein
VTGFLNMVRGASAFVGTPSAGALLRTTHSINNDAKAYEGMALLVSALLVAATFSAVWVRFEATLGVSGFAKRGWVQ